MIFAGSHAKTLTLITNVRPGWKGMPGINILSYYKNRDIKSSIKLDPGPNVIKLFTDVIYECLQQARVFVHGTPFQPSLMTVCKAGAYPIEESLRCSTLGLAHKQWTRLERLVMDKHSCLLQKIVNYGH
jgi:hypothetical protein